MTTFLLIRHALNDTVGRLIAGRAPGVRLNADGRAQAESLAERLAGLPLTAVYSSPLERARKTAEPLARRHGLEVRISEAFNELDFGGWTGRSLFELEADEHWRRFNSFRSSTRPPGGETMLEAQARMIAGLERLRADSGDAKVAVVGHGDPIRAAVMHYAGIPLDLFLRVEISPASVSVLELSDYGPRILSLNDMCGQ